MLIRMTKTEVDTMTVKETNLVGRLHTLACSNDTRLHLKSPAGRDLVWYTAHTAYVVSAWRHSKDGTLNPTLQNRLQQHLVEASRA
jgi:hypothetical protein